MVNRTTLGYLLMILGSAAGLTGILHVGSKLRPPPDWSGVWEVVGAIRTGSTPALAMIDQSGVFLVMRIGHQPPRFYKMIDNGEHPVLLSAGHKYVVSTEAGDATLLTIVEESGAVPALRLRRNRTDAP